MPPAPKVACRKCGKFIAKTSFKRHEDGCGDTKQPFACSACPKRFKQQQGLKKHFHENHGPKETHPCSVPGCDKTFDAKAKLLNHFNQCHTDKFMCTCGKNHASMQNLNKHILQMTQQGDVGHEPKRKKVIIKPDSASGVNNKRKADQMDPVEAFFDAMSGKLNRPDPTNPLCQSKKLCTTSRLKYGFPGGRQRYCSKHGDEVPGLVDLHPLCKYVGCAKRAHTFILTTIGQLNFCAGHRNQLIEEGLPDPDVCVKAPVDYGKKCLEKGCTKGARYDGYQYCVLHSITKNCDDKRVCEISDCNTRPSVGYPGERKSRCGKHKQEGMISHGLCIEPACDKRASYGILGGKKTSCVRHRKDEYVILCTTTCAMACCSTSAGGLQAVFFHPEHEDETSEFFNKRICRFGRRVLIEDALMHNDISRVESLMAHFRMDRILTLNAQSAFRFECEGMYHELLKDCVGIVFDGPVESGPKVAGSLRPDIFYKWCVNGLNYGIHIEYDERVSHEDDSRRLECIANSAGCCDRVYVIRVFGGHDTKNPACTRVRKNNFEYFRVTTEGENVAVKVADAVVERIKWIEKGLGPCDSRPSRVGI